MIIRGKLGQAALGAGALVAAATLAGPASAQQLFFDWGGGSTSVGGSGRETVRFNPQYGKGQVIVSFGDRRLYYITQPGQAISYPIAVPREQSRWAGVHVRHAEAREPVVDADADHDRREPAPAALGAGRPSDESAGQPCALPRVEHVPHPWHRRALDHRYRRLEGLHPPLQSGCAGPLSASQHRHQGDGHLGQIHDHRIRKPTGQLAGCEPRRWRRRSVRPVQRR